MFVVVDKYFVLFKAVVAVVVVAIFSKHELFVAILSAVKDVKRSVRMLALVCIISLGKDSNPRMVFFSPVPE